MGFVVGDALGVPYEFKQRKETQNARGMIGFGSHNQPVGSWSDDSSMTFQLVENLIEGYNRELLKKRFCNWYYYGEWTHDHRLPFDIGKSTFKSLSKIKAGISKGETGVTSEQENGNGSVMRVLPLAFTLYQMNDVEKFDMVEEVSGITHAHIRSKMACSIYVEMAIQLLKGNTPLTAYKNMIQTIKEHYNENLELNTYHRILNGSIHNLSIHEIRSTGYVVDSMEATLWSLLNSSSYQEAVLSAVRLGEDTDTIGAMTGGLAGIYYGADSIPSKWKKRLARIKEIEHLIERFYQSKKEWSEEW